MGHKRTDSQKRYYYASLICAYLRNNNRTRADVTARDIAEYHQLSGKSVYSISAMLNFLYNKRVRDTRVGFYIKRTSSFKKSDCPHHYTLQLIDGAPQS